MERNAWIAMIAEEDATGGIADAYDRLRDPESLSEKGVDW